MLTPHLPWVVFALLGSASLHGAVRYVTNDRLTDLHRERERVNGDLETALRAGALRWAPDVWEGVEAARRAALASGSRADDAYWWFSGSLAEARRDLDRLGEAARAAIDSARHREAEAQSLAREALAAAEAAVEHARSVREFVTDQGQQRRTAQARLALAEAQRYAYDGDHLAAAARAAEAEALAAETSEHARALAGRYQDAAQLDTWLRWVARAAEWSRRTGRTSIVVSKAEHRLVVYDGRGERARFDVDLGRNWLQPKLAAGDGAVPEGQYRVVAKKGAGASLYYKALLLDYPNSADLLAFRAAKRAGRLPASATVGGLIEIHGSGGRGEDWTNGCVALDNDAMDAVFASVEVGTPVTIVGATRLHDVDGLAATTGRRDD